MIKFTVKFLYAQVTLESILDTPANLMLFRYTIREMWMRRAELYFDGRNDELPYITHRYLMDRGLRTSVGMSSFYHRVTENFNDRNPQVLVDRVYHVADDQPSTSQGISSANYYLQTHIHQFYRIIFFFNYLNLILDDNNDDKVVIPTEALQLLDNDEAYRNYLLFLKTWLESTKVNNAQSFSSNLEEYLIYMLKQPDKEPFTSSTTTLSSTTISGLSSTTPAYDSLKRKDSFIKNKYGKNIRKSSTRPE